VVDRVIVLAAGKVLADGPPREIAHLDDGWIRSYFAIRTMVGGSPNRSDGS
jgi:ABC-type transporter Mla maintaining outer membrane lipid asymmetry ATPase subunit MlaF